MYTYTYATRVLCVIQSQEPFFRAGGREEGTYRVSQSESESFVRGPQCTCASHILLFSIMHVHSMLWSVTPGNKSNNRISSTPCTHTQPLPQPTTKPSTLSNTKQSYNQSHPANLPWISYVQIKEKHHIAHHRV